MLIVHISRNMAFAPFWLFVRQKVQKAQKTDFCNPRSVNFQHFPTFQIWLCWKCGKFRWFRLLWYLWILWRLTWFPHRYAVLNTQSVVSVVCMLNVSWKEIIISIHLHNKHFRHNKTPKMLKMFIVHAPASPFGSSRFICRQTAPYALLVSHLCQKCYGVITSGNSPFVNLRSEHLFLRYAYRSGTIFSSAVSSVKQHSADI